MSEIEVWLTREKSLCLDLVNGFREKPRPQRGDGTWFVSKGGHCFHMSYDLFFEITGIKLKHAECKKFKIIRTKNGFKMEIAED